MRAAAFLTPESSPAGPLLLLWGEGECCCLGMAATYLQCGLGAGKQGLERLSLALSDLLTSPVSRSRLISVQHHPSNWDGAEKQLQKPASPGDSCPRLGH